jgi:hypothetical protein
MYSPKRGRQHPGARLVHASLGITLPGLVRWGYSLAATLPILGRVTTQEQP